MGHNGFRVVYDHDGGRQRRMQREQGRTQSADSSSSIGSGRMEVVRWLVVFCLWVDPGGGNPKWEIPSRSNSFVFQSQLRRLIREKMHLRFQTGLVQFSNFTILEDLFDFGARDGEVSCPLCSKINYYSKVDTRTNVGCHENHCIKRLSHLWWFRFISLVFFSPSECPGLCRH